jgi:hypothetical protein
MADTAPETQPALGICLEEYEYPYPVRFLPLSNDLQPVSMAYGDIPPSTEPNGGTVVLFHGKAFGCYYFRNVIEALTGAGYRVIAPAAADIPRATRVVIPDCGHIPHLEHPAQFLAELLPFLAAETAHDRPRCSASHGPVTLSRARTTASGVPAATICPPSGPPPGPMSMR